MLDERPEQKEKETEKEKALGSHGLIMRGPEAVPEPVDEKALTYIAIVKERKYVVSVLEWQIMLAARSGKSGCTHCLG